MSYQEARNVRREARTLVGRFRGGKLVPTMATVVRGSEGGTLSQSITLELDPIAGRLITPITAEMYAIAVPVQAIDAIKDPEAAYAGMTEVLREKLLSGNPLFGLENESEISKRCGVNPRSIAGVKKVNEAVRLAYNAAVNYLRTRKYVHASKVLHTNTAITPALIGQTVLDRLNGVLDPDDRINGMVNLELPTVRLPVEGVYVERATGTRTAAEIEPDGDIPAGTSRPVHAVHLKNTGTNTAEPLEAVFSGVEAGGVSLVDFYNAETQDRLTRAMGKIIEGNPEYGQELVLRWAHGLSMDTGKIPFVIAEKRQMFGRDLVPAMDSAGVLDDTMRSDMALQMGFNVPLPKTELGYIVITLCSVKPDETLSSQPHPFLSDVWAVDNFVADELALDPVPVTIRELDSDCLQAEETNVALYVGHNGLKQTYVHYGLNRHLDPDTVENKTAVWQLEVPMSVTPESVLYPETLEHYPFADQTAEVVTYVMNSQCVLKTPLIFGPTPVETLPIIGTADLFEENA